jgi:transcriptional regulator with XRE-family HTH domain
MKDRVQLLIKSKNFTAAQFADEIGVQKSGVSHILSGRNNPSLDFIQKILTRFPEISTDWLLFGKGPMMINDIPATFNLPPVSVPTNQSKQFPDLFSQDITPLEVSIKTPPQTEEKAATAAVPSALQSKGNAEEMPVTNALTENASQPIGTKEYTSDRSSAKKTIQKIIVMYDDKTFAEFLPES